MKRIFIFTSILLLNSIFTLAAQSNKLLDDFLDREAADSGTSILLIAQALGELADTADAEDAMEWLSSQKWGKKLKDLDKDSPITTGQFHLALFQGFEIKGGMIFTLFKTPRSAAQEAGYQGYINGTPYVNHKMTALEVLESLSIALNEMEEKE